jgi:hypothetical protein
MLRGALRENRFQKKKVTFPLYLLLPGVADCVHDEVDLRYCFIIIITLYVWLTVTSMNSKAAGGSFETVEHEHAGAVCLFGWVLMPNCS